MIEGIKDMVWIAGDSTTGILSWGKLEQHQDAACATCTMNSSISNCKVQAAFSLLKKMHFAACSALYRAVGGEVATAEGPKL